MTGPNGRRVEVDGRSRAACSHATQAEAIKARRDIARRNKSELLVQGRNGRIRERNTYGHGPRNVRGQRRRVPQRAYAEAAATRPRG